MLNCLNSNYETSAFIEVTGGTFLNDFNPADNYAEGEHTNFVASGYESKLVGTNYVVSKILDANYTITIQDVTVGDVDIKVDGEKHADNKYTSGTHTVVITVMADSEHDLVSVTIGTVTYQYTDFELEDGLYTLTINDYALVEDVVVSAEFIELWTVSFNTNGGSTVQSVVVRNGLTVAQPAAPTKTGYEFAGWFVAVDGNTQWSFDNTVTADTTIFAHWTAETYAITYYLPSGDTFVEASIAGAPASHTYGTATNLVEPTSIPDGKVFGGWFTDSDLAEAHKVSTLGATAFRAAISLYAKWDNAPTTKQYTLTLTKDDFKTGGYAKNDGDHTFTAKASDNSTFSIILNVKDVYQNNSIQSKASSGCIYNKTSLGKIISITVNTTTNSADVYYGTSQNPTSGALSNSSSYFTVKSGSKYYQASSIVIVFEA